MGETGMLSWRHIEIKTSLYFEIFDRDSDCLAAAMLSRRGAKGKERPRTAAECGGFSLEQRGEREGAGRMDMTLELSKFFVGRG